MDLPWSRNLTQPKKLPLLGDIIDSLCAHSRSQYVAYTNPDIALRSDFYVRVAELLRNASMANALSITRKSTAFESDRSGRMLTLLDMPEVFRMARRGEEHPGHDCFVFQCALWRRMEMGNVFLGYPTIGRTLLKQLSAMGSAQVIRNSGLTLHIGHTRRMTEWLKKLGWRERNASVDRYDVVHHEHSQLNRFFCDQVLKRLRLK